jgi:hypothetical protein
MEDNMLRHLSICAALTVLSMAAAQAQQQEAMLRKIVLQNAGFDIVVAMPRPGAPAVDYRGQPDPTIGYTAGGRLVLALDANVERLVKDFSLLLKPACSLDAGRVPVAVFVVPNDEMSVARPLTAVAQRRELDAVLLRLDVPGAEFDVVFGLSSSGGGLRPAFAPNVGTSAMIAEAGSMPTPSCVAHAGSNDDESGTIAVYVVPKPGFGAPAQ